MSKKEQEIKVLYVEPLKAPKVMTIKNELETLQKMVGGYIECVNLTDDIVIILNEEGKINNLLPNRALYTSDGEMYDIIMGSFIIAGDDYETGNFISLHEENINHCMEKYHYPELFMKDKYHEEKIVVQKVNEELGAIILEDLKAKGQFNL